VSSSRPWFVALVAFLLTAAGARAQSSAPVAAARNVCFVADGAGNYQMASKSLRTTASQSGAALEVETFVWSHGYKRIITDQVDMPYARQKGKILAETVLAFKVDNPGAKIQLVGHSAGSLVVLSAAELLPPDCVDHIILLSPSVSTEYDIRPALRCARCSVEVHFSQRDWVFLGIWTGLLGCADRRHCVASGRVGFRAQLDAPADAPLRPKLVQHAWNPSFVALGNYGGHYGGYQPDYLRERVLPVLLGSFAFHE
jgi:pimeloyl-ACP methyl ester carboxylesterase